MDRAQYARYVLARIAGALAVALGAGLLAHLAQSCGWITPLHAPAGRGRAWPGRLLGAAAWWAWPAAWAAAAHVLLGPKQERPVYRRIPGAMYAYAGVVVDRNAGCRGGFITGATGSGKTLCCILPRLHSLCVNESGTERAGWRGSPAQREFNRRKAEHRARRQAEAAPIARLLWERGSAEGARAHEIDRQVLALRHGGELREQGLQAAADLCRAARFRVPPWGGFVCGEKGNEWQSIEALLRHHGREEDLCILRTRPAWAPAGWSPSVRFNPLSMDEIPADTFAQMIVETGLSVEEAKTRDEFFVPQARDKIAWGIRLARAVDAASAQGRGGGRASLLTLFDVLTVQESYRRFLLRAAEGNPLLPSSAAFAEARFQLENNYWNQPPDQLGGVRSTVYNFLAPFAEPEIAEVFCADSTFDLRDIQHGKVVCTAIPQKLAVQRRYVATLMKALCYQVILQRFDRRADGADWLNRNVILVEQDEWQRHAIRADCEADVVREAQGAIYAATQSQNAVWAKLGGRDGATPLIANLRNRWICQAATEECAEESSGVVSGRICRENSYSHGQGGRTTSVSFRERPYVPKRELRSLQPFHVLFVPAEGRWLYRKCIAMPATPDGRIPPWWFGDWNPLHWAARFLRPPRARSEG